MQSGRSRPGSGPGGAWPVLVDIVEVADGVAESKDGGATWTKVETPFSTDVIRVVHFTTLQNGLAAGSGGHIWRFGLPAKE